MSSKHKQYDETFKREAVQLWQSRGKAAGAVEDDLGISRGLWYKWRQKIEASGAEACRG